MWFIWIACILVPITGCITANKQADNQATDIKESPYVPLVSINAGIAGAASDQAVVDITRARNSNRGLYKVSAKSDLEPVVINKFHSWILHVETSAGQAVDNAAIQVSGAMPAHDHDMPAVPEVTRNLGNGDYLVEGMIFQMPGLWKVMFYINSNNISDTAIFDLELE
jgi:hypothetical protein